VFTFQSLLERPTLYYPSIIFKSVAVISLLPTRFAANLKTVLGYSLKSCRATPAMETNEIDCSFIFNHRTDAFINYLLVTISKRSTAVAQQNRSCTFTSVLIKACLSYGLEFFFTQFNSCKLEVFTFAFLHLSFLDRSRHMILGAVLGIKFKWTLFVLVPSVWGMVQALHLFERLREKSAGMTAGEKASTNVLDLLAEEGAEHKGMARLFLSESNVPENKLRLVLPALDLFRCLLITALAVALLEKPWVSWPAFWYSQACTWGCTY
jgi:hypothetical protein